MTTETKHTDESSNLPEIPIYGQLANGCGLASILMLINPRDNIEIRNFLDRAWKPLELLFGLEGYKKKEYKWAIGLQYLLLKISGYSDDPSKEEIYSFYEDRLGYAYEDQRILNQFNQETIYHQLLGEQKLGESSNFLHYTQDHDFILPDFLTHNIHTMKTDMELRILLEIFDYQFVYTTSEDMTGAIYFSPNERGKKKLSDHTIEKWKLLERYSADSDIIILYGQYYHWVAARKFYRVGDVELLENQNQEGKKSQNAKSPKSKAMKNPRNFIIQYNDPATLSEVSMTFDELENSDRFYVFKLRENREKGIQDALLKIMKHDLPYEIKRWRLYLQGRTER